MVQREVEDRFFAEPSTKAYGAVSVLIELAARPDGFLHPVARTVLWLPPNVDPAPVGFSPLPERFERIKALLLRGVVVHRRKTLPNSLALSGFSPSGTRAAAALEAIGRLPERPGRGAQAGRVRRAHRGAVKRAPAPVS